VKDLEKKKSKKDKEYPFQSKAAEVGAFKIKQIIENNSGNRSDAPYFPGGVAKGDKQDIKHDPETHQSPCITRPYEPFTGIDPILRIKFQDIQESL
jgi:hypothetical protein